VCSHLIPAPARGSTSLLLDWSHAERCGPRRPLGRRCSAKESFCGKGWTAAFSGDRAALTVSVSCQLLDDGLPRLDASVLRSGPVRRHGSKPGRPHALELSFFRRSRRGCVLFRKPAGGVPSGQREADWPHARNARPSISGPACLVARCVGHPDFRPPFAHARVCQCYCLPLRSVALAGVGSTSTRRRLTTPGSHKGTAGYRSGESVLIVVVFGAAESERQRMPALSRHRQGGVLLHAVVRRRQVGLHQLQLHWLHNLQGVRRRRHSCTHSACHSQRRRSNATVGRTSVPVSPLLIRSVSQPCTSDE
jgi:hypothetical protein